jgi:hypothetical protein
MVFSTLPGGSADKAGNLYEALWGVLAMLEVLEGKASSIRIEAPGEDGAEFYLQKGDRREYWQSKRQLTGQDTWTISKLKSEGVLSYFKEKYLEGHTYVFASTSDAPSLGQLVGNAQNASTYEEFLEHFVNQKREKEIHELEKALCCDGESVFGFLNQLKLQRTSEDTLKSMLTYVLGYRYDGNASGTLSLLRDLYMESIHKTLTADIIENYLAERSVTRQKDLSVTSRDLISALTDSYLAEQQAKLIGATSIPRKLSQETVEKLVKQSTPQDVLITSTAGGGKSACLYQIVNGLKRAGIPVLAFRLDRIAPVTSTIALGKSLGLPHSPVVTLSEAYKDQPVVVVIDQVDCVSTASGRSVDFFDSLAALRQEILGLRGRSCIHFVLACRKFDFEHDYRLKQLLPKDNSPYELKLLSENEVQTVLGAEGMDIVNFSQRQRDILKLPQNLSLFLQSGLRNNAAAFATPKDLFDAYWDTKRRAVSAGKSEYDQLWISVISHLANRMSESQQLSVPLRDLDNFPPQFIDRLTSEAVLTREQNRYGFSHESFFDYCFARTLTASADEYVAFLEGDSQKLFRRAQLRQVLAYFRDEEFNSYLGCVKQLLRSDRVRPHLKLSAVELVCSNFEPRAEELSLLMPWIETELAHIKTGTPNPDKLASRIWSRFFISRRMFPIADEMGYVEQWLNSGEDWLENTMTNYLRWQSHQHAGRVAELLEPFVDRSEAWNNRLCVLMQWGDQDKDRRYFELFLRLLDLGILDHVRDGVASNGTFWSMLHGFAEKQPAWCAELAAHWLDRQVVIVQSDENKKKSAWNYIQDHFGAEYVIKTGERAPEEYLEYVLPSVLRAAQAFAYECEEGKLAYDSIWQLSIYAHDDIPDAFLIGCEKALAALAISNPEKLGEHIEILRQLRLRTANRLLLHAYQSAPIGYADEAIEKLAREPERLKCGFGDSPFWIARQLIEATAPHASDEALQSLEVTLMSYATSYENSKEGFKSRGYSAYTLISAIPEERLSIKGKGRLREWKDKFGTPKKEPEGIRHYTVVSPIKKESAEHMTDDQWLNAIEKYNTEDRHYDWSHPEKGGGWQLSAMLEGFVKEEPWRFAQLCLRFPEGTLSNYYSAVLRGLKDAEIDVSMKMEIIHKIKDTEHYGTLVAALDMLGSVRGIQLPIEGLKFISDMADYNEPESNDTEGQESDPREAIEYDRDTVPARVAEVIRNLVFEDAAYVELLEPTIVKLTNYSNLSVRAMAASTLYALASVDEKKAITLFLQLIAVDIRLLATNYAGKFMRWALHKHFSEIQPTIQRMLSSDYEKVREEGGILAGLACLYHEEETELSERAFAILYPEHREWCIEKLSILFADADGNVRKHAADCFRQLWNSPETPLGDYEVLIEAFRTSRAFEDDPTTLFYALESTRQKVPEVALKVCEEFVRRCVELDEEATSSMRTDEHTVGKIVFTIYTQLQDINLQNRVLNLIDTMCLEGLHSAEKHLSDIER